MTVTTITRPADADSQSVYVAPQAVIGHDVSEAETAEDALAAAGLAGWNVHLRPMQSVSESITESGVTSYGEQILSRKSFMVVRTSPTTGQFEEIGTVGNRYHPVQNEELADFLQALVFQSGGQITSGGDFYGKGEQFFMTLDLPDSVLVGGKDLVNHSITIFSSHDGSVAITPVITATRVMCQNQRNMVLKDAVSSTKVRHTATYGERLTVVQNILGIAKKETETFAQKADVMASAKITDETFWEIVAQIWTPADPNSARATTMQSNRLHSIASRLHGPESANISGTAWAAYNAVTSHLQHSHANASTNAHRTMLSAASLKSAQLAEKLFHSYALQNA